MTCPTNASTSASAPWRLDLMLRVGVEPDEGAHRNDRAIHPRLSWLAFVGRDLARFPHRHRRSLGHRLAVVISCASPSSPPLWWRYLKRPTRALGRTALSPLARHGAPRDTKNAPGEPTGEIECGDDEDVTLPRVMWGASGRPSDPFANNEMTFRRRERGAALAGELEASDSWAAGRRHFTTSKNGGALSARSAAHHKFLVVNAMEGEPVATRTGPSFRQTLISRSTAPSTWPP